MNSLFIFRTDLRIEDNTALLKCLSNSDQVILVFIFDPKQIDPKKNKYFSNNSVQFMIESLHDLDKSCNNKINFLSGKPEQVINQIYQTYKINSVYVNKDYTPYSIKRDEKIEKICKRLKIDYCPEDDLCLNDIDFPVRPDNSYYKTFTSYLNSCLKNDVTKPQVLKSKNLKKLIKISLDNSLKSEEINKYYDENSDINVNGGREKALKILNSINTQKDYDKLRSLCNYHSTHLSAYIKYGCVSIREVYYCFLNKLGKDNGLIKQLYWRDFYYYIIYHFPETYTKKIGLKNTYQNFPWETDKIKFKKWCQGKTGFPIVDASMINLNTTGYMPNRSRLIVANFLTKLLRIDWKYGEKYFAQNLVDYSVSNNLGNWQWVASIGADYQNRIYNPMSQSEKSDPKCEYIKKWLPQLNDIPNKDIHNWNKSYHKYLDSTDYQKPIIDYKIEYDISKQLFKKYL